MDMTLELRRGLDLFEQLLPIRDMKAVPEHFTLGIHRQCDVLRLRLRRNVGGPRQIDFLEVGDHRDGDEEDDQQHEHDVHERSRVDRRHDAGLGAALIANAHCHRWSALRLLNSP
jgi:hypothetical protein